MEELFRPFANLRDLSPWQILINVFDVAVVAFLIYRLLLLVRGTRAWRILGGIVIFVALLYLSQVLGLNTLHWILDKATLLGPVALVILLLPELRAALEGVGKLGFWPQRLGATVEERAEARTVEEIVAACAELVSQSTGALIVVEKGTRLDEIASNGVQLNAAVSAPLLNAIFYEGNPLHDGAVIVRGDSLLAAACRLPLSESQRLEQNVHMRHRAAVGVTESTDCLAIVVSEERATISIAQEGFLRRLANHIELRDILNHELRGANPGRSHSSLLPKLRREREETRS